MPWLSQRFSSLMYFVICVTINHVLCVSHWIATEDGKIRPKSPSIFALRAAGDLTTIHRQEERFKTIKALRKELLQRKEEIDRCEKEAENTEEKVYAADPDCQAAGSSLTELDLYVSTAVPFDRGLFDRNDQCTGDRTKNSPGQPSEPRSSVDRESDLDCRRYMTLDFSMHAFEHLVGVRERENLTMIPEVGLSKAFSNSETDDLETFAERIICLLKFRADWVAFNLAALYWREKGSVPAAVECLRRALHVSPDEGRDVALISLANVLHRARLSDEAAVVAHAAIDIAPDNAICHFTLGSYAVLVVH